MTDVSGFGLRIRISASNTFPIPGFELSQFADDSDPLDFEALQITDDAVGLNGDLIVWTVANALRPTINLISGTPDQKNMTLLFEANRAGRNKASAKDVIQALFLYPDGQIATCVNGACREFPPARSVAGGGKQKSNAYTFSFENIVKVG